ncbi:MAG: 4Fe-4S binding protein [Alphaproteobacteria bacterium]|nr:4Fe-4S binding protein [Alphaproteobacteria bacterium]
MLNPKNNAAFIRTAVLVNVARSFIQHNLENIDDVPNIILPDDTPSKRGSLGRDRLVVKAQCMAAMGYTPSWVDTNSELSALAQEALKRTAPLKATVSVIKEACNACVSKRYVVSDQCQTCYARPCEVNCPKQAITVSDRAHINQDLCIKCGICYSNCPYQAIHKDHAPCEDACPVGALSKDAQGHEYIDQDKCISCGKCILSCPFGAIVHNSQMFDVLNVLKNSQRKKIAMLAPAVIGQFGNDLGKVITAFKKLGFDEVVEVAQGADVTTKTEAAEFVERMKEGKPFMTTSCCPAWVAATEKHIPEIKPFVSNTGSPMYYIAEIVKKQNPDCVAVFVGPCLAKRLEAEKNPNVDYVLVFEEAQAMLTAAEINVAEMTADTFAVESSAQGRRYPISGGVAGAVAYVVGNEALYKPERIDGLTPEAIKKLKRYATIPPTDFNMVEVMCCEGGCIAGPGTTCMAKKAALMVENYVKTSPNIEK